MTSARSSVSKASCLSGRLTGSHYAVMHHNSINGAQKPQIRDQQCYILCTSLKRCILRQTMW